ncbi:MAG: hypothetical protein SF028_14415 [Candidatus Sumerlaeia bacterium]|nr:hypothetical protein [Candidatus Sumerlaeia bacterium]
MAARRAAALLALVLLLLAAAPAQDAPPAGSGRPPAPLVWLQRYELAWGVGGLYVLGEGDPDDPAAPSRQNLLALTLAGRRLADETPGIAPNFTMLRAAGYMPALLEPAPVDTYSWNAETRRFESSLGPPHDLATGARRNIAAAQILRGRYARPTQLVRDRWAKLADDPQLPQALQRELTARAVIDTVWESRAVLECRACLANREEIERAATMYGQLHGFDAERTTSMGELDRAGLLGDVAACPAGGKYSIAAIGGPAVCSLGGPHGKRGEEGLRAIREADIVRLAAERPDDPPRMALAARMMEPAAALETLDRAAALWPDTPLLRLERLAHLARAGRVDLFEPDLVFLVENFPAAPVLAQATLATALGPYEADAASRAEMAAIAADARPDVLPLQLAAIEWALAAGRIEEARRLRARLAAANPGYDDALPAF